MNDLLDRTRAHLDRCALCFDGLDCEAFALLHAEARFEERSRFRLWIDGVECLFIPTAPDCWHVAYAFNTGKGAYLTPHYIGRPAGSIKAFEQAASYARACINSASLDLLDHLKGIRPTPAMAGLSCKGESHDEHELEFRQISPYREALTNPFCRSQTLFYTLTTSISPL